jgi:hypothetical protein
MSAISDKCFPNFDGAKLRTVTTKPSARAGYVNVIEADGSVCSCQGDGSQQTRPAGTDGPWEQGLVSGQAILYTTDGITVFAFPYYDKSPA